MEVDNLATHVCVIKRLLLKEAELSGNLSSAVSLLSDVSYTVLEA